MSKPTVIPFTFDGHRFRAVLIGSTVAVEMYGGCDSLGVERWSDADLGDDDVCAILASLLPAAIEVGRQGAQDFFEPLVREAWEHYTKAVEALESREQSQTGQVDPPPERRKVSLSLASRNGTISIGKMRASCVEIDHESVARMHALIHPQGDFGILQDLGTARGTAVFCAGEWSPVTLDGMPIQVGDIIRVGEVELEIVP